MVFILIQRTDSFGVNQENLEGLALVIGLQELGPAPESLSAGIDCGPHSEAPLVTRVNDHSIEKERFACAVLASDTDHTHGLFDPTEKLSRLITHNVDFWIKQEEKFGEASDYKNLRFFLTYFAECRTESYGLADQLL